MGGGRSGEKEYSPHDYSFSRDIVCFDMFIVEQASMQLLYTS